MSNQSPQRNRKQASQYSLPPGQIQPSSRREQSPSPTARDRQRYTRAQSLPLVPPLTQIHPTAPPSQAPMSHEHSPQNTTTSHQSRSSSDDSTLTSVPPPMHPQGHIGQQGQAQNISQPSGSLIYPRPMPGGPLPPFLAGLPEDPTNWQMSELMLDIERADLQQAQMRYQAQLHQAQLQTQVRNSNLPAAAPGTEGVAYAGGAVSYRYAPESPQRSLPVDKSRVQERDREHSSPQVGGNSGVIQGDAAPAGTPLTGSPTTRKPAQRERGREEALRDSPRSRPTAQRYRSNSRPLTPEGRDRTSQMQQTVIHPATPPALKKVSTASPLAKAKTPDRSLPVQEEPEEEGGSNHTNGPATQRGRVIDVDLHPSEYHRLSPTPSSDLNPMNDLTSSRPRAVHEPQKSRNPFRSETDDDQGTLVELDHPQHQPHSELEEDEESEGAHTPRSPSTRPLEQNPSAGIHELLAHSLQPTQAQQPQRRQSVDALRDATQPTFDATVLENAVKKLQESEQHGISQPDRRHGQSTQHYQAQPQQQQSSSRRRLNHDDAYMYGQYDQFTQAYQDELESYYDQAAYLQHYLQSPQSRPGAPIPPTPRSNTAAPTPNPSGGLHGGPFSRPLVPPFSPAPPGGTPYPYPFSHLRRMQTYPSVSANPTPASHTRGSVNGSIGGYPMHDPLAISEQLALQWQMYAMNNSGTMSDSAWSTFSPSATPYPPGGSMYTPFNAFLSRRRAAAVTRNDGDNEEYLSASRRSSPSHEPVNVPLPALRGRALRRRGGRISDQIPPRQHVKPPPRVESTQPKETSPEPSSGEETAGEHFTMDIRAPQQEWVSNTAEAEVDGENGQWVADDADEDEDDWLDLEFHTTFVSNIDKRRKRFNQRWNELAKAFQALDRETDTTLVLLAAPSHTDNLHSLSSRSIRRDPSLLHSPALANVRSSFVQLAGQRRASRSRTASLLERLSAASSSGTASPSSTASREEDLRRALGAALNSLDALGKIYEGRELRWREEMRRLTDEREGVELLLSQTLGVGFNGLSMGPPA